MSKVSKSIDKDMGDANITLSNHQCLVMRGDENDARINIGSGRLYTRLQGDKNNLNNATNDPRIINPPKNTNWNKIYINGDENDVSVSVNGWGHVGIVMIGDENDITVTDPISNDGHINHVDEDQGPRAKSNDDGSSIIINETNDDSDDDDDDDGCGCSGCSLGCSGWVFGIIVAAAVGLYFHSLVLFLAALAAVIAIGWIIDAIVSVSIVAIVVEVIKKVYHDLK